jgi:hypothetical protein
MRIVQHLGAVGFAVLMTGLFCTATAAHILSWTQQTF